jgi:hypothetical protein
MLPYFDCIANRLHFPHEVGRLGPTLDNGESCLP